MVALLHAHGILFPKRQEPHKQRLFSLFGMISLESDPKRLNRVSKCLDYSFERDQYYIWVLQSQGRLVQALSTIGTRAEKAKYQGKTYYYQAIIGSATVWTVSVVCADYSYI